MARIADIYWRIEKRFGGRPPTRSQRFSARHPVLIGALVGVATFAIWLAASLGAGNGVAYSVLVSLLGGFLMGAVLGGTCLLERRRQQKLFGDR